MALFREPDDDRNDTLEWDEAEANTDGLSTELYEPSASDDVILPEEITDEVVRFYAPMVYRIALTKTKSSHDAEDIFQEVFMKLVMNQKPFDSEEHRKAWIIRVTINCCNSHFVAPWRKHVDLWEEETLSRLPDEDSIYPAEDTRDVYAKVLALPQNMKEVILLYYYENMSVREIAEALGTTEVNIKKRLSRARQKLKLDLEGDP